MYEAQLRRSTLRSFGKAVLTASLCLAATLSCRSTQIPIVPLVKKSPAEAPAPPTLTPAQVFALLNNFATRFAYRIEDAADQLAAGTDDREIRRLAAIWKMRTIHRCRQALFEDEPHQTVIRQWTLCVRLRHSLASGESKDTFGAGQPIALGAARAAEADMVELAGSFLGLDEVARLQKDLEAWVVRHPLQEPTEQSSRAPALAQKEAKRSLDMNPLLRLPFASLRAVTGLDETTRKMQDLEVVVARASAIADHLPQQVRWEVELMLYDVERRETVQTAIAKLSTVSASVEQFTDTAKNLPATIRGELDRTVDKLDSTQARLQDTLALVSTAAKDIEQTVSAVGDAGRAWESTGQAFGSLMPAEDEGAATGSEPFDINEYTRAAEAWAATASAIEATLAQFQAATSSTNLTNTVAVSRQEAVKIVEVSRQEAAKIVDHLAWRGAQLIFLALGVVVLYRILRFVAARSWKPKSVHEVP